MTHHKRGQPMPRHQGFALFDTVMAMTILVMTLSAIYAGQAMYHRGQRVLEDHRTATRQAEFTLTLLQTRQPLGDDPNIRIERLESSGQTTQWCRVHVTHGKAHVSLVGIVPRQAQALEEQP